jgi:hypothetical protein
VAGVVLPYLFKSLLVLVDLTQQRRNFRKRRPTFTREGEYRIVNGRIVFRTGDGNPIATARAAQFDLEWRLNPIHRPVVGVVELFFTESFAHNEMTGLLEKHLASKLWPEHNANMIGIASIDSLDAHPLQRELIFFRVDQTAVQIPAPGFGLLGGVAEKSPQSFRRMLRPRGHPIVSSHFLIRFDEVFQVETVRGLGNERIRSAFASRRVRQVAGNGLCLNFGDQFGAAHGAKVIGDNRFRFRIGLSHLADRDDECQEQDRQQNLPIVSHISPMTFRNSVDTLHNKMSPRDCRMSTQ